MRYMNEEEIDSSSSTVDLNRENNRNEMRNKLLSDTYYENLDLDNNSFRKCLQRNKLLIFSFLISLTIGIIFLIIMFYR